jgi:hypothetical protein
VLVKGAVGAVPVAGSFLAEIVGVLYRQPIDKRREEWLRDVASALNEIRAKQEDLSPEKLAQNEEFTTVLHRATESAVRTHEASKRRMLRNALVSSALPSPPDLDKQLFFLRLVEELTPNQVLVLAFYADPKGWFARRDRKPQEFYSAGRDAALEQAYPGLKETPHFQELVIADLERRALLGGLSGMVTGRSVYDAITKPLGREFLDYVRSTDDPEPTSA